MVSLWAFSFIPRPMTARYTVMSPFCSWQDLGFFWGRPSTDRDGSGACCRQGFIHSGTSISAPERIACFCTARAFRGSPDVEHRASLKACCGTVQDLPSS